MLPILVSFGPVVIYTLPLMMLLAILAMGYSWWRRSQEEHYDELTFFDALWLSSLVGAVFARVLYVIFHFSQYGWNVISWFDIFTKPGISYLGWCLGAGYYLARFAAKQKWEVFAILDFWVRAVALGAIFLWLGFFFAGTEFGLPTNLPWGWQFPGVFDTRHPSQLYAATGLIGIALVLHWAEFHYRTFEWYRAGRNTAQPGFVTGAAIFLTGLLMTAISLVTPHELVLFSIPFDLFIYPVLSVLGIALILQRAGYIRFGSRIS